MLGFGWAKEGMRNAACGVDRQGRIEGRNKTFNRI
jgi:hypothetical protein